MTRSDADRITDILDACAELATLVKRGRESFDKDRAAQLAIERLLEIIGEASSRLADDTKHRYGGIPWEDVTRLRIVLAHHYHRIDRDQVWTIATQDVPALSGALSDSPGTSGS